MRTLIIFWVALLGAMPALAHGSPMVVWGAYGVVLVLAVTAIAGLLLIHTWKRKLLAVILCVCDLFACIALASIENYADYQVEITSAIAVVVLLAVLSVSWIAIQSRSRAE